MSFNTKKLLLTSAMVAALGQGAMAVDITVFDKVAQYRANGWWGDNLAAAGVTHADPRGIAEDNETEPGTLIGQEWDLEAFRLNGLTLSIIGGFNFMTGQGTYAGGDLFIDVDGDATFGVDINGGVTAKMSNSLFKYDYVIDFEQTVNVNLDSSVSSIGTKYTVRKLDSTSSFVTSVAVGANSEANPWIYHSLGTAVAGYVDVPFVQTSSVGGPYAGFAGNNTHYQIDLDLGFLGASVPSGTLFKYTMECGNDNLIGIHVPDGGATLAMLGFGLVAVGGVRRFRRS